LSENRTLGQFEALRSGTTALVGRDEETELLLRRWAQAKAGNGRVVLISAEPGVGKSRLAEALAKRIAADLLLLAASSGQRALSGDRANGAGSRLRVPGRAGDKGRQTTGAASRYDAAD
jgi:hypothetical protein